jgi:hypothetical protein
MKRQAAVHNTSCGKNQMPKKKAKTRQKLAPKARKQDALRWLMRDIPKNLLAAYSKRYGLAGGDAHVELIELGFDDTLRIQFYECEGTEWEYKMDGYTGEMKVVPKGTPDWELHQY